jgi:hypothetical protein
MMLRLAPLLLLLVASRAGAETFELVTYTPPAGWVAAENAGARVLSRQDASGAGFIMFFPGRAAGGSAADVFAEEWRARAQPIATGAVPRPTVKQSGDLALAAAVGSGSFQGQSVAIASLTIVGRGRAQTVVGVATTDAMLREIAAFIDGLGLAPAAGAAPPPPPPAGELELDVDVPPEHVARREGGALVIAPAKPDRDRTCVYAIHPARPSRGSLEADARAGFADAFPGWRKRHEDDARNKMMRGTAAAGWPFYGYRADLERARGEYAIGMVMAVPAASGRVSLVTGIGSIVTCRMDDLGFARLFHGLRPRGVASDGGKALARDLVGSWISSVGGNRSQYVFAADGGYRRALDVTTGTQISPSAALERTTTGVRDGRWSLRGSELTLTADNGGAKSVYRIRVVDESEMGRWTRALYLLDEGARPPYEVQYLQQTK